MNEETEKKTEKPQKGYENKLLTSKNDFYTHKISIDV